MIDVITVAMADQRGRRRSVVGWADRVEHVAGGGEELDVPAVPCRSGLGDPAVTDANTPAPSAPFAAFRGRRS